MHREAVTQQTKKEGHSGASVISGLFPGVQVERDWWGALQQVCSCRSRLAHKRRLTATERRGETPSGKFSPNNSSLFLVRSSWVRGKSRKHGFGSRSWVKMSSPHCGSANCWHPFYTTADLLQDIHHIYVDWASTAKEQHQTLQLTLRPKSLPASATAARTACSSFSLEQCVCRTKWRKKIMFCCIFEKERFRFGLDLTIKLTSVS